MGNAANVIDKRFLPDAPSRSPMSLLERLRRQLTHDLHIVRRREIAQMRRWLKLRPTDRGLDVGCGDGYYTERLLGGIAQAAGIDIDHATMRAAPLEGSSVKLIRTPAETLPFGNQSFDLAVGVCAMEHFEDDGSALREMRRTLRPGGQLVLSVDSLSIPGIPQHEIELHSGRYHVRNRYTVESLREKLAEAGFELLEHRYIITSMFAYRLVTLAASMRKGLILFFPLAYPLIRLADWITGRNPRGGYILIARAVAASGP